MNVRYSDHTYSFGLYVFLLLKLMRFTWTAYDKGYLMTYVCQSFTKINSIGSHSTQFKV